MNKINNFQIKNLKTHPEFRNEIISLIEKEFNYFEHSFEKDFYLLMNIENAHNCYFLYDEINSKVVCHIAILERNLIKNYIILPVIFIGGIATKDEYKGKGFFRYLMNYIIQEHNNNCALMILWSELQNLYEKFSFYQAGLIIQSGNKIFDKHDDYQKTKFTELSEKEFNDIKKLYTNSIESDYFTVKRSESEWNKIKKLATVDLYIKKENDDVISYFCLNKGRDLQNIIHEFVTIKTKYKKELNSISDYQIWLNEAQGKMLEKNDYEKFFCAFFRLANIETLNNFIKSIDSNINISKSINSNYIDLTINDQIYTLDENNFLSSFFGPFPAEELEHLSLTPLISGIDSI